MTPKLRMMTARLEIEKKVKVVKASDTVIDTLNLAEDFYSVQGEGNTSGVPAYFIRLKACNLMCGGPDGSLMKEGKATWWCDTEYVWRKGLEKPFQYLVDRWTEEGILDWIKDGRVNLIWTGGEPTIPKNQRAISGFLNWFYDGILSETGNEYVSVCNEIETNGTIYIQDELFELLHQINCSVKLANSGMESKRRINPRALERIMSHDNYWFKFVISTEDDLREIERDFITPFNIPAKRVLMMPGLDKQENYHERTKFCMEMGKKYGYTGLTRLHVSAWDQLTGV
jgi:7-carboxy-7-deazaguanine synthase